MVFQITEEKKPYQVTPKLKSFWLKVGWIKLNALSELEHI
jgi:hypothetical protein